MGTPANVVLGAGDVYVAPIGTTEPASATAALDAAWRNVGYTDGGATFGYELTSEGIAVDQEFEVIRWETTARSASIAFPMAEATRQNLALALNAGADAANTGSFEPPEPGAEVRVMVLFETDDGARWLFRQCFQAGNLEIARQKAPAKALIAVTFRLEKPSGSAPFKVFPSLTTAGLI